MANTLTKKQLQRIAITDYAQIRNQIKSGDLFFCSGNYWISKQIAGFTNSPWSHIGIIIVMPEIDRVLLLESVEDMGVRIVPLSKYLNNYEHNTGYDGELLIASDSRVNSTSFTNIFSRGVDLITQPYDKDEIIKILGRIILGTGRANPNDRYICSELVYECFNTARLHYTYNNNGFISPQDIWVDRNVDIKWRLK